jgi:hypothetical protein
VGKTQANNVLLGPAGFLLLRESGELAAGARQGQAAGNECARGSGRDGRILRRVLTENLMLSFAGGAGLGSSLCSAKRDSPDAGEYMEAARVRGAVRLADLWVRAAGERDDPLVFGLAPPAWPATRVEVSSALKGPRRRRTGRGLAGTSLLVAQVAMSLILVVGARLFVQTLVGLVHTRLGFNPDHITLFGVVPPQEKYPQAASIRLYREIKQKLAVISGVERDTLTRIPLISENVSRAKFPTSLARGRMVKRFCQSSRASLEPQRSCRTASEKQIQRSIAWFMMCLRSSMGSGFLGCLLSHKQRHKEEEPMMQAQLIDRCKLKVYFKKEEVPA